MGVEGGEEKYRVITRCLWTIRIERISSIDKVRRPTSLAERVNDPSSCGWVCEEGREESRDIESCGSLSLKSTKDCRLWLCARGGKTVGRDRESGVASGALEEDSPTRTASCAYEV